MVHLFISMILCLFSCAWLSFIESVSLRNLHNSRCLRECDVPQRHELHFRRRRFLSSHFLSIRKRKIDLCDKTWSGILNVYIWNDIDNQFNCFFLFDGLQYVPALLSVNVRNVSTRCRKHTFFLLCQIKSGPWIILYLNQY